MLHRVFGFEYLRSIALPRELASMKPVTDLARMPRG
jgi:hypothetical protein